MAVSPMFSISSQPLAAQTINPQINQDTGQKTAGKFGDFLKNAIADVNKTQLESDVMTSRLVAGEQIDLHEVMITAQKASITLQTALEVRNKAVESYQEIMRMQV